MSDECCEDRIKALELRVKVLEDQLRAQLEFNMLRLHK